MEANDSVGSTLAAIRSAFDGVGDDAQRLFHGRGGAFPGWKHLTLDWYAPAILVTLYGEESSSENFLVELDAWAGNHDRVTCLAIQRRYLAGAPVEVLWGDLPDRAHEAGMEYMLSLEKNQNHGFFPDMEPGRSWVRERAAGKRVLNLFAYTCALSVTAVAGGASEVVNLDQSSRSLAMGRENHRLNFDRETCCRVSYLAHDLFKSWGRLKRLGPFDLVILDPPSHQPGSFVATKDYPRLLRRVAEVCHPEGAEILACLNAPELDESFLADLFNQYLGEAELVMRLPDPKGYSEAGAGWGLKRLVYRV